MALWPTEGFDGSLLQWIAERSHGPKRKGENVKSQTIKYIVEMQTECRDVPRVESQMRTYQLIDLLEEFELVNIYRVAEINSRMTERTHHRFARKLSMILCDVSIITP